MPTHKQLTFECVCRGRPLDRAAMDDVLHRAWAFYSKKHPNLCQRHQWGNLGESVLTIWGQLDGEPVTVVINYSGHSPMLLVGDFWFPDGVGPVMVRVAEEFLKVQVRQWLDRAGSTRKIGPGR